MSEPVPLLPPRSLGIVIFRAESETAAHEIMQNDPAVAAGVMLAELVPYRVALRARTWTGFRTDEVARIHHQQNRNTSLVLENQGVKLRLQQQKLNQRGEMYHATRNTPFPVRKRAKRRRRHR
ncbi:MAG: hypothetical protein ABIF77_14035, partial [bacterium]